jgi:hypothetical protein
MLPARADVAYRAHIDSSSGRSDSAVLSIAHREDELIVIDCVVARRPPFDPAVALQEFAEVLRSYDLYYCGVDRYAPGFVEAALSQGGVSAEIAAKTTSEIFLEVAPHFMTHSVRLPNDKALLSELKNLERRTSRTGKDQVSHPPSGHDDHAAAVAGSVWACAEHPIELDSSMLWSAGASVAGEVCSLVNAGYSSSEAMASVETVKRPWLDDDDGGIPRPGPFVV